MARRSKSDKFVADGIDRNGKRVRLTFQTERQADNFKATYLTFHKEHTIGQVFPKAFAVLYRDSRDSSVEGRMRDIVRLMGPDTHIRDIDTRWVMTLREKLVAKGNKRNTIANKMGVLSMLLQYCVDMEILTAMPKIDQSRDETTNRTRTLTREEEDAIFNHLPQRYRFLAIFLIDTACRGYSELRKLRWGDIDYEHMQVSFFKNKTNKPRTVPMTEDVRDVMKTKQAMGLPSPWCDLPAPRSWWQAWNRACAKAGIVTHEGDEKLVPYHMRHTTATRLAKGTPGERNGLELFHLMEWLGHSNPATTRRYTHLAVESLRPGVEFVQRKRGVK